MRAALVTYGVLLLTVFVDLITAVVAGAFVANMLTIHRLSSIQSEQVRAITHPDQDPEVILTPEEQYLLHRGEGRILLIQMSGPMSFGAARTIGHYMGQNYDALVLDFSRVPLVGVTASMTIESEIKAAQRRHQGKVFIVGARAQVKDRLRRFQLQAVLPTSNFLPDCYQALQRSLTLLNIERLQPDVRISELDVGISEPVPKP